MSEQKAQTEQQPKDDTSKMEASGEYPLAATTLEPPPAQSSGPCWIESHRLTPFSLFRRAKRTDDADGIDADDVLAGSIRAAGGIDPARPLLGRPMPDGTFEVIRGNRVLRAAFALGYNRIPIVITPMSDAEACREYGVSNAHQDLLPIEYGVLLLRVERATEGEEGGIAAAAAAWGIGATKATKLRGAARVLQIVSPDFAGESGLAEHVSKKIESLYMISTLDEQHWPTLYDEVRRGLSRAKLTERITAIRHPAPSSTVSRNNQDTATTHNEQTERATNRMWLYPGRAPEGYRWIDVGGVVCGIEQLELVAPLETPQTIAAAPVPTAPASLTTRFEIMDGVKSEDHDADPEAITESEAEVTAAPVTLTDIDSVLGHLEPVEPSASLVARLTQLIPGVSVSAAWSIGALDAYEFLFGKQHAHELRQMIQIPDTKAKSQLKKLGILHTDKVQVKVPRTVHASRPIVLVLAEDVLGMTKLDGEGKAPTGQVAVVGEGHVVLLNAQQTSCDQALIFRSVELGKPDWLKNP